VAGRDLRVEGERELAQAAPLKKRAGQYKIRPPLSAPLVWKLIQLECPDLAYCDFLGHDVDEGA
jgi:hypothetical protein